MLKRRVKKLMCFAVLLSISIYTLDNSVLMSRENTVEAASAQSKVGKVDNFEIKAEGNVGITYNLSMDDRTEVAQINEFWGYDGNYHIAYSDTKTVYIAIVSPDMKLQKTIKIPMDLEEVGAVVQDKQGNYYIVYGKGDPDRTSAGKAVVISIVKYDKEGKQLKRLTYTGMDTAFSNTDVSFGSKEPFAFGNCDLIIDGRGTLVCHYARIMYNGHQSSTSFYVDSESMAKLDYARPYTSHSFEQRVIETSSGDYLFADRGDAFERGFTVSKLNRSSNTITAFVPFHFKNGYVYQDTYATLAGISEVSNGYVLAGASENTLTYDIAESSDFNESRNIFLQVFSKNFTSNSTNNSADQYLKGETRKAQGTYVEGTGELQKGAVDYGVLWLTKYTKNIYASNPKVINIGNDQLLLLWEKKEYKEDSYFDEMNYYEDADYYYEGDDEFDQEELDKLGIPDGGIQGGDHYIETCYMVVSGKGEIIIPETSIQRVHITELGEPTYKDGYIYWITSNGYGNKLVIHRLDIGEKVSPEVYVTSIKPQKDTISLAVGQKVKIQANIYPTNASNKGLWYHYDKNIMSIDENGYITGKKAGSCLILLIAEDNPRIFTHVMVNITKKDTTKKNTTKKS